MDRKTIKITTEDLDDVLDNDHFEFRFVKNIENGWLIQQSVTSDYYEVEGYLENGEYILTSKIANQVFPVKTECIKYE